MRNISVVVTKDHILTIVLGEDVGDEISVSDFATTSNVNHNIIGFGVDEVSYNIIGFGIGGSATAFSSQNTSGIGTWDHWGEYVYPTLETRFFGANTSIEKTFGFVASSNNTMWIGTCPREDFIISSFLEHTDQLASQNNVSRIQDTSNGAAFQLFNICQYTDSNRDVITFEKLETIVPDIPDSEVTII